MSKSLGNFTNLLDLVESTDPRAYRMLVLRSHYRSPVEVTAATTDDAAASLRRLDSFARRMNELNCEPVVDDEVVEKFRAVMDDDLDTPAAVAMMFGLVTQGNSAIDAGDLVSAAKAYGSLLEICAALGVVLQNESVEVPADIASLAIQRDEARAEKNWARADEIRDELLGRGWLVEDTADGTRVRRA